ncbi:transglutaminase-like cysteine peptidase [Thiohalobacter sp.]|uniref:transglutaminase-like cysteine peptidase n=1 Tax=Thiohalobacter sp. TaxID=2025948 RepID=UPI002624C3EE|nr:transglutaminase-like cysteine peptidase [Thiohalobacter sp.]
MPRFAVIVLLLALLPTGAGAQAAELFGYRELRQSDISPFTQWLSVLERHVTEDVPEADCSERRFNRCHLRQWRAFLDGLRGRPLTEQLQAVNAYANRKPYVLDIDNYGIPDYWAVAREFLYNGGDCEDYAITKLFSLLWLGVAPERMRLVVLQDTNLRIPHAVLAVFTDDGRTLILDNQIQAVVEDRSIVHYVPVYSINQQAWWIHTPRS